ncbi:MAG: O-antigen ligase family protein, partial [bacterium]
MKAETRPIQPSVYAFLFLFALTAVASIALQNFIWIAVALFLVHQFRHHLAFNWPRGIFALATLLFLASFFWASLIGVNPAKSFHTVHKYLVLTLIFWVGATGLNRRQIQNLLLGILAGASVCAVCGIFKYWDGLQDRITSFSGDKMVFGGLLMVCFLLEIFFIRIKRHIGWMAAALPVTALALFFTQTRGAWVGSAAGFILLMSRFNRKWIIAGALSGLLIFFILPRHFQKRIESIAQIQLSYDAQGHLSNANPDRIMIWISGWRLIQDHPWGIGQGNLVDVYPHYKFPVMHDPTEPHLHNNFLQILAQNGWLGLALYLFWIFAFYRSALGLKFSNPEDQDLNWTLIC